jgi:Glycosyltransferase family 28 C-terminal domain
VQDTTPDIGNTERPACRGAKRLAVVYIDAGGGHRSTATALTDVLQQQRRPWSVELLNADDVLDPADPPFRIVGMRTNDFYNLMLRHGWTIGTTQLLPVIHGICRLLHPRQVRLLRVRWKELRPDLVISLIPHLNRALFESLRQEFPNTPFVTILTDLADYPPHFWIEPQPQHFICGTPPAVEQARTIAPNAEQVWPVSGMVIHRKFYEPNEIACQDRTMERRRLDLDPELPTGLVLFGGYGSRSMIRIARTLAASRARVQLILLCGRNDSLQRKLRSLDLPFPVHIQGFTDELPYYMSLSDFFIGKPGSGSISEALAMRLPLIVKSDVTTIVQERYNVKWIEEQGIGLALRRIRDLPRTIEMLLEPQRYNAMRARIQAMNNRAVFEVPEILEQILYRKVSRAAV